MKLTVPDNDIVSASGELANPREVLSEAQRERLAGRPRARRRVIRGGRVVAETQGGT